MDYSKYSIEELIYCFYHINVEKYQHEYFLLEKEIKKRLNWDNSISLDSDFVKEKFYEIINKEDEVSKKNKLKKSAIVGRLQVLSLAPIVIIIINIFLKIPLNENFLPLMVLSIGLYSFAEFIKSIYTGEIRIRTMRLKKKERPILFLITQLANAFLALTLSLLSIYRIIVQIK